MGLGSKNSTRDDDGDDVVVGDGNRGGTGGQSRGSVSCTICIESVTDNGDRSWAKLRCGHKFHLDCIGSAFNAKGVMQCPNCRRTEKGRWCYASGSRSTSDVLMDDWNLNADYYDLGNSETSFGVQWCPIGSLGRLPSSFEEGEFPSSALFEHTDPDLFGQHMYPEHTTFQSPIHPCPYIGYYEPIHPSSFNSGASASDGSASNNYWSGPSIPGEMMNSFGIPLMDAHHHSHSSQFSTSSSRNESSVQHPIPSVTQRPGRTSSVIPRTGPFGNPFLAGHSSSSRAGSSAASSMIPPHPGSNARTHDRVQALQAYYHQQPNSLQARMSRTSNSSGTRRSSRGLPRVAQGASSSSDQAGGSYFIPSSTSTHNFQDSENPLPSHVHTSETDQLPSLSLNQDDREPSQVAFHQAASGILNPSVRRSIFRRNHRLERTSTTQDQS